MRTHRYISAVLFCAMAGVVPASLEAQVDPVEQLEAVLPEEVAEQVIATVNDALARGLPGHAVAELALQGVAQGRSGAEVLEAAQGLVSELDASRFALERGGRTAPDADEIEAAQSAMRMGVDGAMVSELAQETPSGRSLAVPLLVTGALMDRGLPSDQALANVQSMLDARATDADLASLPEAADGLLAAGVSPAEAGLALGMARAPITLPVSGLGIPLGPPTGLPGNPGIPGDLPGVLVGPPGGVPVPGR